MKRRSAFVCFIVCMGSVGCDGDSGLKTAGGGGSGGGSATGGAGAVSTALGSGGAVAGSGVGGGGVQGSGANRADAGHKDSGSAITPDASQATMDVASPSADGGITIGSCPTFTPCGGHLVGTWHRKSQCMSPGSSSGSCEMSTVAMDISRSDLTFTFTAGGTVTLFSSGTIYETIRYSSGCFGGDAGWRAQSCTSLPDAVMRGLDGEADAGASPVKWQKFECSVDSSQACICNEVLGYDHMTLVGTYTTAGNQLALSDMSISPLPDAGVPDAGTEAPADYCVSGDTLTLRLVPTVVLEFTR